MKTLNSLVAALALFAALPASAANWVAVAGDADLTASVDIDSLRYAGSEVKVWQKFQHRTPQDGVSIPANKYRSGLFLSVYDCANRTITPWQSRYHSDFEGGKVVHSLTIPEEHRSVYEVQPDTISETILKFVCKTR